MVTLDHNIHRQIIIHHEHSLTAFVFFCYFLYESDSYDSLSFTIDIF